MGTIAPDETALQKRKPSSAASRWMLVCLLAHAVVLTSYAIVLTFVLLRAPGVPGGTPPPLVEPLAARPSPAELLADEDVRLQDLAARSERQESTLDDYDVALQNIRSGLETVHEKLSSIQAQLAELEEFKLVRVQNSTDVILSSVELRFPGLAFEFASLLDGDVTPYRAIHSGAASGPLEVEAHTLRVDYQLGTLPLLADDPLGARFTVVIYRQDGKLLAQIVPDD